MHVASHRPEKVLAAAEQLIFVLVKDAALDQFVRLTRAIDVFGDPEQSMQVTQPAFAILHVRFNQITRLTAASDAIFAFSELRGNELRRGIAYHFVVESRYQLIE